MNNKNVLVISSGLSSAQGLQEWTKMAHPFHINVIGNDEEAIECCHLQPYDVVLIDRTDDSVDAKKLQAVIPILQESIIVFQYDGESSENITEWVESIFSAQKYRRILNMLLLEPGDESGEFPQFSLN